MTIFRSKSGIGKRGILFFLSMAVFFIMLTLTAEAASTYTPLVGIPKIGTAPRTLPQYLNALYILAIIVGALFGVVRIAFAGVKYSLSDIITDKATAKKEIFGVLLGLTILLIPYIVLNTINPDILNLDVLKVGRQNKVNLGSSQIPYSAADATAIGRTIEAAPINTEVITAVQTGTDDEQALIRAQCQANSQGGPFRFYKENGNYHCIKG